MATRRTGRPKAEIADHDSRGGSSNVLARRKLGLKPTGARPIAFLMQQLKGGKAQFMEFAHLAVHIEPELAPIVEDFDKLNSGLKASVSIDEICAVRGVDPLHFIAVVGEAALKFGNNGAILIAALHFPAVIGKSVKEAMTSKGFKDRELLAKHHGFVPTPHGTSISVQASAGARADASSAPESKGLPSFERSMREVDDIVRERE